jgi:SAM-dependent methyltransferase
MGNDFANVYDDEARARAYSALEFPATYYLAYRDLPEIIRRHVSGGHALDFGCGAGRSTRFVRDLGFQVIGVDIAEPMLALARERDPAGDYRLVRDGDLNAIEWGRFDLVLSAFTFDNIPTRDRKVALFRSLAARLAPRGRIVSVVSTPEVYVHEWASFSTRDFPENRAAKCGDPVRIIMLDVGDRRPVEDTVWTHEGYLDVYRAAELELLETQRPLGLASEPWPWKNEATVAPWAIYVLGRESDPTTAP